MSSEYDRYFDNKTKCYTTRIRGFASLMLHIKQAMKVDVIGDPWITTLPFMITALIVILSMLIKLILILRSLYEFAPRLEHDEGDVCCYLKSDFDDNFERYLEKEEDGEEYWKERIIQRFHILFHNSDSLSDLNFLCVANVPLYFRCYLIWFFLFPNIVIAILVYFLISKKNKQALKDGEEPECIPKVMAIYLMGLNEVCGRDRKYASIVKVVFLTFESVP